MKFNVCLAKGEKGRFQEQENKVREERGWRKEREKEDIKIKSVLETRGEEKQNSLMVNCMSFIVTDSSALNIAMLLPIITYN